MEEGIMNFKSLREDKLKLSQEQFASVYGLDLSAVKGTITGFRIEPKMTDCCIYVDWIKFE